MTWTEIPAGQVYGAGHILLSALGKSAELVVNRLNTDKNFAVRAAGMMEKFVANTTPLSRAYEIMRAYNLLGINEGFGGCTAGLGHLTEYVPFSETVLEACKDTHILAAVPRCSIADMYGDKVGRGWFSTNWYMHLPFAINKGTCEWKLVRMLSLRDPRAKTWSEQRALVSDVLGEVADIRTLVYVTLAHFFKTHEWLYYTTTVRCNNPSPTTPGDHMCLSISNAGININGHADDEKETLLGLAVEHKPTYTG